MCLINDVLGDSLQDGDVSSDITTDVVRISSFFIYSLTYLLNYSFCCLW